MAEEHSGFKAKGDIDMDSHDIDNVINFDATTMASIVDAVDKKHTQNADTALGAQSEDLDMNTHKVVSVVDPVNDQEAATKKYVDDNVGGALPYYSQAEEPTLTVNGQVCIWNTPGVFTYIDHFDTSVHGTRNYSITTDGTNIYAIDLNDKEVYKYTMAGAYVSSFDTSAHGGVNLDLTTDGTNIWVADRDAFAVYKYTMAGAYVSSFSTVGHGSKNYGITTDGANIWTVDYIDKEVYEYTMAGVYVTSYDISVQSDWGCGVATDGTNIWVADRDDQEIYKYAIAGNNYLVARSGGVTVKVALT